MEPLKRIFERMNINQISTFILFGDGDFETDMRSYEKRIKEDDAPMYRRLEHLYPDGQERDDFLSDITQALVIREQVYMEIGLKAGVRLLFQLLSE